MSTGTEPAPTAAQLEPRTLRGLVRYYLSLGASGFGGPIALVGYMHRDLVQGRRWFTEAEFQQGMAVAQMMPGPLAAQLAMWFGYLHAGARGAAAVAAPFVLAPFLIVTSVAVLYAEYQGLAWVHHVFRAVGPAVLAIITIAAYKLGRSTNKADPMLWIIGLVLCAATAISGSEIVWLFVLAAVFGAIYYGGGLPRGRSGLASVSPAGLLAAVQGFAWTGSGAPLGTLALFFVKAGAFTFGSGLAIVPFLHGGTVVDMHWLTERQFLDAVAVSMITPGPVVITVAFIGYLVAGPLGAIVAAAGVFLPAYLMVVLVARWFQRAAQNRALRAAVDGVTAAATGAIAGAVFVLGRRAIVDGPTVLMFLATLAVVLLVRKVPEPVLLLAAGLAGILLHGAS
jgi:chromate transporter